jgi:hypothetical protein
MKIKKINAAAALFTAVLLIIHVLYCCYEYIAMYYNETLKTVTALPFMIMTCLHAVMGMLSVFLLSDGTRADLYPRLNRATVIQRTTAALVFPLLILHLKTFEILKNLSSQGQGFKLYAVMASQVLFYAVIMTHTAVSISRALVTLGIIKSNEKRKKTDRIVFIFFAALFIFASFFILKGEAGLFLKGGK